MSEPVDHVYICPRCGGGGEEHYLTLMEDEEAPALQEFHGDDCNHDEACAADDAERLRADVPPVGADGTA